MNNHFVILGGATLEEAKCFDLILNLNVHILKSMNGCFDATLTPSGN